LNYVEWDALPSSGSGVATSVDPQAFASSYRRYVDREFPGSRGPLYAIWSPTVTAHARAYGLQTYANSNSWRDSLIADPRWQLVYARDGSYLFRLREG